MDFIDLHCDTITEAMHHSVDLTEPHLNIHLPVAKEIERYCQCFAVYCPDTVRGEDAFNYYTMAKHYFQRELAKFPQLLEQIHTAADIDRITAEGKTGAVLTVEGGAVLNGKTENLRVLKNDGVKMITLTWNGENELGCGSSNQTKGLSPFGFDAVKEMERLGMIIDVSHLSDAGLDDVLKTVSGPVAASHSNLRSVCGYRRNLTDEQFCEIARRGGIVGVNFYRYFLNNDGEHATVHDIARHIEHMLELGGENAVAMGSDFDGCDGVDGVRDINDIPALYKTLCAEGIPKSVLKKIFWQNARDFFERMI